MTTYRGVQPHEHKGFFNKAQNGLKMARMAYENGVYDTAVSNCVHSAINAIDAATALRIGKRSAGHHAESVDLIGYVFAGSDRADLERQYRHLLGMKKPAEYTSTMMTARQAADALKCAERILAKVRAEIEK